MSSYATLNPSFVTSGHFRKNNATFMATRNDDSKLYRHKPTDIKDLFERAYCKVLFDNKIIGTGANH